LISEQSSTGINLVTAGERINETFLALNCNLIQSGQWQKIFCSQESKYSGWGGAGNA
jgi:hypothetical protein